MKQLTFLVLVIAFFSSAPARAADDWSALFAKAKPLPGNELPASLAGKVVVVNVWATWCHPCIEEFPLLNGLVEKYRERNVVFVAVTAENASKFTALLAAKPFRYLQLSSGQKVIEGVVERSVKAGFEARTNTRPLHVVLGTDGSVRFFETGFSTHIDEVLAQQIDLALGLGSESVARVAATPPRRSNSVSFFDR